MDDFLLLITLGEYVAGGNALDFARYFSAQGNADLAYTYQQIADDEFRHFKMLKKVVKGSAKVPDLSSKRVAPFPGAIKSAIEPLIWR